MKHAYSLFYKFFFVFFICLIFCNCSFAAYPKLVSTLTSAFESIETWIIKISTPAAAVAVRYRCFYEKI